MHWESLWRRFRSLTKRCELAAELEEESRIHAQLRTEQLERGGTYSDAAQAEARRLLGNRTLLIEDARDYWGFVSIDTISRHLRLAARTLRRNPLFTVTALLTLGIGIGANTAVFSLVDATLLRPLPYKDPARVGQIVIDFRSGSESGIVSYMDGRIWEMLRDHASALDCAALMERAVEVNLAAAGRVRYVKQQRVSAGYFKVLGAPPLLGREFTRAEDVEGGPALAVLSYGVWKDVFGGAEDIAGRKILLRGEPHTVVGVAPAEFESANGAEVWTPLRPSTHGEGANKNYAIIGRLNGKASWEQAATQVETIGAQRLSEEHDMPPNYKLRIVLVPLQKMLTEGLRTPVLLLWCGVLIVLIIGCINIAGLLVARGKARQHEIGTRMALGGGRGQVIAQLLTESLLLAALSALLGLLIGEVVISVLRDIVRQSLGLWQPIGLDLTVLLVTCGVSVATMVVFGLWPAIEASRVDIRTALAVAGRTIAGGSSPVFRRVLITAEIALSVVLLITSGLVVRSFLYLRNQPTGFNSSHVTAASLPLQDVRYRGAEKGNRLFDDVLSRLREMPGVTAAGAAMSLPYERGLNTQVRLERGKEGLDTVSVYVTPDYFRTLSVPIIEGRTFTAHDQADRPRVGVVNQYFAQKYFGSIDPVGRMVYQGGDSIQIVGVVPTIPMRGSLGGYAPVAAIPVLFVPAAQVPDGLFDLVNSWFTPSFVVRSNLSEAAVAAQMQTAIQAVDPLLPFSGFRKILEIRSVGLAAQRFQSAAMLTMAVLALLLAAVGLYGLIAYLVGERKCEFGIRIALGASAGRVAGTLALQGMGLAATGIVLGILASFSIRSLLQHMLWGISANDPATMVAAISILLAVVAAAILIPATRILRLNPANVLRNE